MKNWFDDLARAAARRSASAAQETHRPTGPSRRELLKRAGVVGGATLWMTPVIQSVLAPPAAASGHIPVCTPSDNTLGCGGTCPDCNFGGTCIVGTDCASGICSAGTCQKAPSGGPCGANSDCTTASCVGAICQDSTTGGPCSVNADCGSNVCGAGSTCTASANGGACAVSTDCVANNICTAGNLCRSVVGQPCTANAPQTCASGNCGNGNPKLCL